jgi:hypothetical protein
VCFSFTPFLFLLASEFRNVMVFLNPVDLAAHYDGETIAGHLGASSLFADIRMALGPKTRPTVHQRPSTEAAQPPSASVGRSPLIEDALRMILGGLSAVIAQVTALALSRHRSHRSHPPHPAQSFCQPIETVKVRLQNEASTPGVVHKKYSNFFRGFRVILAEEGVFRGLYKGMTPAMIREMSYSTLR